MRYAKTGLAALIALSLLVSVSIWRVRALQPKSQTEVLAPGLTLTTIEENRPWGALQMRVVRANWQSGWRLGVVPAARAVLKRETVAVIARAANAPVAVNGGFFAYDGAAVGPLVIGKQWIRLPWKSRTAIGFGADGKAKIDNLKVTARVVFGNGQKISVDNLNGSPGKNGIALLTSGYGNNYKLKAGEKALSVTDSLVSEIKDQGNVVIAPGGFVLLASGNKQPLITSVAMGKSANFKVEVTPEDWQNYPTILGAGPRLVKEGRAQSTEVEEEFKPDVTARGPRSAIGVDRDGNWIMVVITGWQALYQGATLPELAQEMQKLGAVEALNLDGGASVALVVNQKIIAQSASVEIPVANAIVINRVENLIPIN